jgi:hypothetical protein
MQDESPEESERAMAGDTQAELAAREAASIGGDSGVEETPDQAMRPVQEAGGGEAEGFEQAEEMLVEHASHTDQQSAHVVLHDEIRGGQAPPGHADGEADRARSSARDDEEPPAER